MEKLNEDASSKIQNDNMRKKITKISAIAAVGCVCLFSGCKRVCHHEARLDRIDHKNTFEVNISEWASDGQSVVLGVCSRCGYITHSKVTTDSSISVSPVSNSAPTFSFGYPTKQAKAAMERAQADLIMRIESSTNAVVVRGSQISAAEFSRLEAANSNRFLLITGCEIRQD